MPPKVLWDGPLTRNFGRGFTVTTGRKTVIKFENAWQLAYYLENSRNLRYFSKLTKLKAPQKGWIGEFNSSRESINRPVPPISYPKRSVLDL